MCFPLNFFKNTYFAEHLRTLLLETEASRVTTRSKARQKKKKNCTKVPYFGAKKNNIIYLQ